MVWQSPVPIEPPAPVIKIDRPLIAWSMSSVSARMGDLPRSLTWSIQSGSSSEVREGSGAFRPPANRSIQFDAIRAMYLLNGSPGPCWLESCLSLSGPSSPLFLEKAARTAIHSALVVLSPGWVFGIIGHTLVIFKPLSGGTLNSGPRLLV